MGAINTNKFSFVNLHKHYFGSYTDLDNMPAVEAACANDMGVFIISPTVSLALDPRKIVCRLCRSGSDLRVGLTDLSPACFWLLAPGQDAV